MSIRVTLADIRAAADKKYGDYEIDLGDGRILKLRNALRLPEQQRDQLMALLNQLNAARNTETQDLGVMVGLIRDMVRFVADSPHLAEQLLSTVGDDLGVLMELVMGYMEVATPGEASPSDS